MAVTLRIDGQDVRVATGDIKLNRQAQSFTELSFRGGDFTYTIRIVRDLDSEAVFRPSTVAQAAVPFARDTPYEAELLGAGQRFVGQFILQSVTPTTFDGNFIGETANWIALLEGKGLRDIEADYRAGRTTRRTLGDLPNTTNDILDNNTDAIAETSVDTYTHSDDYAVVFPLIMYGAPYVPNKPTPGRIYDTTSPAINADYNNYPISEHPYWSKADFTPCFYVVRILRAIFEEIGWGVGGSFVSDPQVKRLVVPYNGEGPWTKEGPLRYTALYNEDLDIQNYSSGFIDDFGVRTQTEEVGGSGTDVFRQRLFDWNVAGTMTLAVDTTGSTTSGMWTAKVRVSNAAGQLLPPIVSLGGSPSTTSVTFEVEPNTIVEIEHDTSASGGSDIINAKYTFTLGDQGDPAPVASILPEVGQLEFIKGIVTLWNLAWYVPRGQKRVHFVPRDQFYEPPSTDFELDGLVDTSSLTTGPTGTAQVVEVAYRKDEDDYASTLVPAFSGAEYRIGGTLGEPRQVYETPFAPTAELVLGITNNATGTYAAPVFVPQDDRVIPFIAKKEPLESIQGDDFDNDQFYKPWEYNSEMRILKMVTPYTSLGWPVRRFNTSTTTDEIVTVDLPRAIFRVDDSGWNDNPYIARSLGMGQPDGPFALHWQNYLARLRSSARVRVRCLLSAAQFSQLRPTQGVKLAGVSYEVVSIQGVSIGEPGLCTLTLLKR